MSIEESGPTNGRRMLIEIKCSCTALLSIDYIPPIQVASELCDLAKQWSKEHAGCATRHAGKVQP